jgi:vancomycin permeability regulator SanA
MLPDDHIEEPAPASAEGRPQPVTTTLLYLLAALVELACIVFMTWMRYRNQGLPAHFLDFTKTANLYGLLAGLPFVIGFGAAAFIRRLQDLPRAIGALSFASVGFTLLVLTQTVTEPDRPILGLIYFVWKAVVLGIIVAGFSRRSRPWWRRALTALSVTAIVSVICLTYVVGSVLLNPITPAPTDAKPQAEYDAGVILGAAVWSGDKPSPVLRERIRTGYELLKSGMIEFIVLTGGNAPNELTEAEVAKRTLLDMGVDPTRIVLEEQTSSTVEQIIFVRDQLTKQGWSSFVIISDQFHLKRALEICAFNDIRAQGFPSESPLGPRNLAIYHLRESVALALYWMYGL